MDPLLSRGCPEGTPQGLPFPSESREQEDGGGRLPRSNGCNYGGSSRCFSLVQPWQNPPCPAHPLRPAHTIRGGVKGANLQARLLDSRKQAHGAQQGGLIPWTSSFRLAGGPPRLLGGQRAADPSCPSSQRLLPVPWEPLSAHLAVSAFCLHRVVSKSPDPQTTCFPRSLQAGFKAGASPSSRDACGPLSLQGRFLWQLFPALPLRPRLPRADPGPKLAGNKALAALCKDTMASAEGASAPGRYVRKQRPRSLGRLPNIHQSWLFAQAPMQSNDIRPGAGLLTSEGLRAPSPKGAQGISLH